MHIHTYTINTHVHMGWKGKGRGAFESIRKGPSGKRRVKTDNRARGMH